MHVRFDELRGRKVIDANGRVIGRVRAAMVDMETWVVDSLRISAEWIRRLVVPYLDQDGRNAHIALGRAAAYLAALRAHLAVRSATEEVRFFHAGLERLYLSMQKQLKDERKGPGRVGGSEATERATRSH